MGSYRDVTFCYIEILSDFSDEDVGESTGLMVLSLVGVHNALHGSGCINSWVTQITDLLIIDAQAV